jgi:hypothetical protein
MYSFESHDLYLLYANFLYTLCRVVLSAVLILRLLHHRSETGSISDLRREIHCVLHLYCKGKVIPVQGVETLGLLREVEATTFSDIRLIDGGKFASPTRRMLFTLFC